jgi:hypothetical protein
MALLGADEYNEKPYAAPIIPSTIVFKELNSGARTTKPLTLGSCFTFFRRVK